MRLDISRPGFRAYRIIISLGLLFGAGLLGQVQAAAFTALTKLNKISVIYTVNSTADPGNGVCDTAECTLREAINAANSGSGLDTIAFNIPGTAPHTIRPSSGLPIVTDPVMIDGTTDPHFAGSPVIVLNGNRAFAGANGLEISAGNSTVRGLVVNNFIRNNDSTGIGIWLRTNGGNVVQGNYIGTDDTGSVRAGNEWIGLIITDAPNNSIGGTTPGTRNLISGNGGVGLTITGAGASGNLVEGNYIGTNISGILPIGNMDNGLNISNAPYNIIGGTSAAARNLISGNYGSGVNIGGSGATGNRVIGNYIGTDVNGNYSVGRGNRGPGVGILSSARGNTVGGTGPGEGNVISGNEGYGVSFFSGSAGNFVQGNLIGTNASGTASARNGGGIRIFESPDNVIGGSTSAARNVISGNIEDGVYVEGNASTGNTIIGNYIGPDINGGMGTPNQEDGVRINTGSGNRIGGMASGEANVIAYNGFNGVVVYSGTLNINNSVAANSIYSNGLPGIDLNGANTYPGEGITANDQCDADTGPNNLQNYPMLTSVGSSGGSTVITGTLNSAPGTTFNLQFFSNPGCDPSGNGEGQTFLGSANVTTDGSCNSMFTVTLPVQVSSGDFVTATATDPTGNTSEFSQCVQVIGSGGTPTVVPTISTPTNTGTLPPATVTRTATSAPTSTFSTTPTGTPACGLNWRTLPSPNPGASQSRLYGVSVISSTDVWAVGYQAIPGVGYGPLVMRWDGANWNVMATPAVSALLRGVATISSNNVWAVGYYTNAFEEPMGTFIMHWDGAAWSVVPAPSPGTTSALYSIAAVNAGDIWAVGSGGGGALILRWNGASWAVADPYPAYGYSLNGVTALSANDVWAVGGQGSGALAIHWDGSQWSLVPVPKVPEGMLFSVDAIAANDVWAVGVYNMGSVVLTMHWNGSQWSMVPSPMPGNVSNGLSGVTAIASNDVWAVGEYESYPPGGARALMQHWDGSTWTVYPTLDPNTAMRLSAVAAVSGADVWAVGTQYINSVAQPLTARYSDPCAGSTPVPTTTQIPTSTTLPTGTQVPTATPCAITFTDVPDTNTFYPSIRCLACRGIISGYSDGTFRPNVQVTRGQLAKIVSNAAGFSEDPNPQIFEDVPPASTFYQWINRLTRRGYMSGYVCGGVGEPCVNGNRPYFRPFANATRGQTSKIVSNTAGYTEEPTEQTFDDVPPTHTFYREIQRLASRGIMGGYPCGGPNEPCFTGKPYFRPQNDVTRGQSAKIVANTFFPDCQTP